LNKIDKLDRLIQLVADFYHIAFRELIRRMMTLFELDISCTGQIFPDGWIKQRIFQCSVCLIIIAGMMFFHPASESAAQGLSTIKADEIYAADFVLKDLNGTNVRLSDFKGKMILLNFMTTWCPECFASIPNLKAIHSQYYKKGLIMININIQEKEGKVAAYSRKHRLPYPTVLDEGGTISKSYGVVGVPVKVLIGRDGRIICWNCRSLDKLLESNLK
jgi:peroxiredoxin